MPTDYFQRLHTETPTRFWVNNPSSVELELAIATGAINCTTNPAFCSKLIGSDPDYIHGVIDDVISSGTVDIEKAAVHVYQRVAKQLMDGFLPLFEKSSGEYGYVTMQDDPREDQDTRAILRDVMNNRKLGPNYMAKIPVIEGGIEALEVCVEENIAICATEVFSIAQTVEICELYQRAVARTGNHPPFYVTHITGIFDEYLGKLAKREGIRIAPEVLAQAGFAVARKEYRLLKERGYNTTMLGGGARNTGHFTEMVGGDVHITINWSTAREIMDADIPIISRMDVETDQSIVDELREKLPDFRKAYDSDGLSIEEYAGYGPVRLFRNAFLKGWHLLLAEVASRYHFHAL